LPGLPALEITPTPIDLVVPDYLDRYRKPGRREQDKQMVPDRP
jgi:hypothetical protein